MDEYKNAKSIFVYLSFENEVNTAAIVSDALMKGKAVYVPAVEGKNMYAVKINAETEYKNDCFGIRTPLNGEPYDGEIDVALVPLVGFDRMKHRLGRGRGYYDRYLFGKNIVKIALAFSAQEIEKAETDEKDVLMDYIVTEEEICE